MLQENQNCAAVQGTNDSSIVSKSSMVKFGYFDDVFLQYFVEKSCRRSPLIHRGYYIRAKAMDHCFDKFIKKYGEAGFQVISFGAGFDSSYFRLKANGLLANGTYIEVDFPDVMTRKKSLIKNRKELASWLSAQVDAVHNGVVMKTDDYLMLGVDLANLKILTTVLRQALVNTTVPTLLLSEVAITYMPAVSSTQLIQWTTQTFSNATFVLYEQIRPNDAFGHVMQNHFNKLSCPLQALNDFPSVESQCLRFKTAGWSHIKACDMNHFFLNEVAPSERIRIENLEPFDEYEEWHLKCAHYLILCAFNGACSDLVPQLLPSVPVFEDNGISGNNDLAPYLQLTFHTCNFTLCAMYGHVVTELEDKILCIGGFGLRESSSHGRLNSATIFQRDALSHCRLPITGSGNVPVKFERMYSTACRISSSEILLIGGRTSPTKPCYLLTLLEMKDQAAGELQLNGVLSNSDISQDQTELFISCRDIPSLDSQNEPAPRWRHTTSCTEVKGKMKCFLYGGRSLSVIYDDFWILDIEEMAWTKLMPQGDNPGCRHSHTSNWWNEKLYIACGLGNDTAYGDVISLDLQTNFWESLQIKGHLMPRYSHTSCVCDGWLLLLGGVSLTGSSPGLCRISLTTGNCVSYMLPEQNPAVPIMLHGHSSVQLASNKLLVLGGGGNCFSFGTHLNMNPVEISFQELIS